MEISYRYRAVKWQLPDVAAGAVVRRHIIGVGYGHDEARQTAELDPLTRVDPPRRIPAGWLPRQRL